MKRTTLLHQGLSATVAGMGHTDTLALVDAGYSVPLGVERIDVAVRPGVPGLIDVLQAVLSELIVDSYVVPAEMADANPALSAAIEEALAGVPSRAIPQAEFKVAARAAKAVVRTGEYSPYGNLILVGGVTDELLRSAPGEVGRTRS